MGIQRFRPGSATFQCGVCGRLTRATGVQSVGNKICPQCYELAGIENDISDGNGTLETYRAMINSYIAEIVAKGGDISTWSGVFGYDRGGTPDPHAGDQSSERAGTREPWS